MNPPNAPLGSTPRVSTDLFRAPSAPPPCTGGAQNIPSMHWIPSPYEAALSRFHAASAGQWDMLSQYLKSSSSSSFDLGKPSSSVIGDTASVPYAAGDYYYSRLNAATPTPAHTHPFIPMNLMSPDTPPPLAHVHNEHRAGILRPIPSRPTSSSSPLINIPKVDRTKWEDKLKIKSEPDSHDSDSAFEDGGDTFNCSRTTPINHKSIKKWRQRSQPNAGSSPTVIKPISVNTTSSSTTTSSSGNYIKIKSPPPSEGPLSAPGSLNSGWNSSPFASPKSLHSSGGDSLLSNGSSFGSPASSNNSSFSTSLSPMSTKTSPINNNNNNNNNNNIPVGIAVARLRSSKSETPPKDLKKEELQHLHHHHPVPPPPPPPPPTPPIINIPKVPSRNPTPAVSKDIMPLGYQWAKDPISGQIYFLPANPLWATTHGYLQWQQEAWLAHQHLQLSLSQQLQQQQHQQPKVTTEPKEILMSPNSDHSTVDVTSDHLSVGSASEDRPLPSQAEETSSTPTDTPIMTLTPSTTSTMTKNGEEDEIESKSDIKLESSSKLENGLNLLTEGISRLEEETNRRPRTYSVDELTKNRLSMLLDAADKLESTPTSVTLSKSAPSSPQLERSKMKVNNSDLNRNYKSPKAERDAKAFIASKSHKSPKRRRSSDHDLQINECSTNINRDNDKTVDEMEAWEIGMRLNLAEIQRKYKEKYKELYKLQRSKDGKSPITKRRKSSESSGGKSPKRLKLGNVITSSSATTLNTSFNDTFVKKYKPNKSRSGEDNVIRWEVKASSSSNPDLSSITNKFKNGKPNPFENLLRLAKSKPIDHNNVVKEDDEKSTEKEVVKQDDNGEGKIATPEPKVVVEEEDDDEDEEEGAAKDKVVAKVFQRRKSEDVKHNNINNNCSSSSIQSPSPPVLEPMVTPPPSRSPFSSAPAIPITTSSSSPSPPSPPPSPLPTKTPSPSPNKEQQTVTPLKIKKPLMLNDNVDSESLYNKKRSKKSKKSKKNKKEKIKKKKMKVSVIRTPPTSSCLDITQDKKKKKKKIHKSDSVDETDSVVESVKSNCSEACLISEDDLQEGLRVLTKIDGHFYPGTIKAISPPDIYGVVVDRERGNKPHIFSREEVLQEAIFEVKPESIDDLPIGTRVCAYWSQKYHHLYPGTVGEPGSPNPKLDPDLFVNIELDDGDSRDIHIDNIRYLPPNYPLVVYDPDPMCLGSRRRRVFSTDSTLSSSSKSSYKEEYNNCRLRNASVSSCSSLPSPKVFIKSTSDLKMRIRSSSETKKSETKSKSTMAAFLPAQQLWYWGDKGSKKGRRIMHECIKRDDDETLAIGDCAVFLSTGRPDRPYIGRLESLWETNAGGVNSSRSMRVKVKWFYHACETEGIAQGGKRVEDLKLPGALFESCHYDENDVQTISHGCDVLLLKDYSKKLSLDPSRIHAIYENNDLYYLAGTYDPVGGTLDFHPNVFDDHEEQEKARD